VPRSTLPFRATGWLDFHPIRDIPIAEYAPRVIKKSVVGIGNAKTDQVAIIVKQHLRLETQPTPADAADGVAAALRHCVVGSFPRHGVLRRDRQILNARS